MFFFQLFFLRLSASVCAMFIPKKFHREFTGMHVLVSYTKYFSVTVFSFCIITFSPLVHCHERCCSKSQPAHGRLEHGSSQAMENIQGLHHQGDQTTKVYTITATETTKEPFFLPIGPSRFMLTEHSVRQAPCPLQQSVKLTIFDLMVKDKRLITKQRNTLTTLDAKKEKAQGARKHIIGDLTYRSGVKEGDPERAGEGWEEGRQTSVEGTMCKGPEAAEGCTLETVKESWGVRAQCQMNMVGMER